MNSPHRPGRPAVQVIAGLVLAALLPSAALVAQGLREDPMPMSPSPAAYAGPVSAASHGVGSEPSTPGVAADQTTDACGTATTAVVLGPAEGNAGTAGTVYRPLRFTNTGTRPCVLHGFPGVAYVTGDLYAQVGPAAEQEGEKGEPVTLRPGGVASAVLALVDVRSHDPALCRPVPVKGLRVYLPAQIGSEFVPLPATACSGKPSGPQIKVRTVTAGTGPVTTRTDPVDTLGR